MLFIIQIQNKIREEGIYGKQENCQAMVDFNKAAFESGYNTIFMLQEQSAKALDNMLQQNPWLPAQTKSFMNEWMNIYKKVINNFKEAVDQNYSRMEEYIQNYSRMEEYIASEGETPKTKTKK